MNLKTIETPNGHIMKDGEHKIFFLCAQKSVKYCDVEHCNECTHTRYLENAIHYIYDYDDDGGRGIPALIKEFDSCFEKLYFSDNDYDWWEKEETDE